MKKENPQENMFVLSGEIPFQMLQAKGLLREPVFHTHNCLEINYVAGGCGINYIQDKEYTLHAGQVYVMNNFERHIAISDGSLVMKIIVFDPAFVWQNNPENYLYLLPFYCAGPQYSNRVALDDAARERVRVLFEEMESEWAAQGRGYTLFLRAKLMELLAVLYRAVDGLMGAEEMLMLQNYYEKIRPSVEYIARHFEEPLSLETLAAQSNMSRTYFSSCFKKIMKMNVGEYVEMVRVNKACLLLATTGKPVTEIAYACGYASLSSFNAAFKKTNRKTPSQYRKVLVTEPAGAAQQKACPQG